MFAKLKTAMLSVLVGLGTLAAIPATAQADGLYLNYGGGRTGIGIQIGGYDRVDWRHRHHRRPSCTPHRAVNKAARYGVRRARVINVGRRTITVAGHKWGDRVRMTFGRAPHCPVVRR